MDSQSTWTHRAVEDRCIVFVRMFWIMVPSRTSDDINMLAIYLALNPYGAFHFWNSSMLCFFSKFEKHPFGAYSCAQANLWKRASRSFCRQPFCKQHIYSTPLMKHDLYCLQFITVSYNGSFIFSVTSVFIYIHMWCLRLFVSLLYSIEGWRKG